MDNETLRILREYPEEILKEDFKPLTVEQQQKLWQVLVQGITPELVNTMASKIKKHQKDGEK